MLDVTDGWKKRSLEDIAETKTSDDNARDI
jgi:hypothetical protein